MKLVTIKVINFCKTVCVCMSVIANAVEVLKKQKKGTCQRELTQWSKLEQYE